MEKPGNSVHPSVDLRTPPPLSTLIIVQGKLPGHKLDLTATFLLVHLVIMELKMLHIFLGGFCSFPLSSHSVLREDQVIPVSARSSDLINFLVQVGFGHDTVEFERFCADGAHMLKALLGGLTLNLGHTPERSYL